MTKEDQEPIERLQEFMAHPADKTPRSRVSCKKSAKK